MKINAEIHDRTILLWLECASDVKMSFVSEIRMNTRFSVFPYPQSGAVNIKKNPDPRTHDRLKEIVKPVECVEQHSSYHCNRSSDSPDTFSCSGTCLLSHCDFSSMRHLDRTSGGCILVCEGKHDNSAFPGHNNE